MTVTEIVITIVASFTSAHTQPLVVSRPQFCVLSPSQEDGNTARALSARLSTVSAIRENIICRYVAAVM